MNYFSRLIFWFSIFPLAMGLFVYLCFGSVDTKIFGVVESVLGYEILTQMRPSFSLPSFIRFHFTDCAWAFSLTSTLCLFLYQEMNTKSLLLISILSLAFYEIGQYLNWIQGTSDILDFGLMAIFSLIAFYLTNKKLLLCERPSNSF